MHRDAIDVAVERAAEASEGGVVLVRLPPEWLREPSATAALTRWTLLFASSDSRDVLETYGIAKLLLRADPRARVGVTIHGARRRAEAEETFERLSRCAARHLGREIRSYGLLVDDLHVYRAIAARRPLGLAHPQSPAARALRDVAGLILEDARELAVV
jgi:MinD-like ATPase involved in chromosome partitioning or flagellar assembly